MNAGGVNQPQKRRYLRRGIAAGLLFVALLMLLADRQQKEMLATGRLSTDDVSAKIMGVFAAPVRGIELMIASIGDRATAFKQNSSLKSEVEKLRYAEHRVLELEARIKIYEDLLGMVQSPDANLTRLAVRSVSEVNGPFAHSALINVGRDKNVKAGHAVVTVDGLYGHVVRSGKSSARVLSLNDLNSQISVMSQRSRSRAIMIGTNGGSPRLDYISPEADWRPGDRVVTSGDGGVLPNGLPIGIVEMSDTGQLGVQLFTRGKPIDWVWVYLFDPITSPPVTPEPIEVVEPSNTEIEDESQ